MTKTCPSCRQVQPDDRSLCEVCGADLPAAPAARPGPVPPPPEPAARCLRCGSAELRAGAVPEHGGWSKRLRFKPVGNWVTTYEVKAVACLGCGFVHMTLGADDCRAMRGK